MGASRASGDVPNLGEILPKRRSPTVSRSKPAACSDVTQDLSEEKGGLLLRNLNLSCHSSETLFFGVRIPNVVISGKVLNRNPFVLLFRLPERDVWVKT